MKTTKLMIVAAIMAFATLGFANSESSSVNDPITIVKQATVKITLRAAIQSPELVKDMRAQLSPDFLKTEQRMYTVRVNHKNTAYFITGTYSEWVRFFSLEPVSPKED